MKDKRYRYFKLQQDESDCGVTCLRNILGYYNADLSLEKLREWSGSGAQGTSILGLHQAAGQAGLIATGAEASGTADLLDVQHPCILHVNLEGSLSHFVVYYPQPRPAAGVRGRLCSSSPEGGKDWFMIGDPAKGLIRMYKEELEKIWKSKAVLLLSPGEKLASWQRQRQKKMRWLWKTLKEDAHLLYIAIGLGAICALLNLSTAIFSQKLVDHILPNHQREKLYTGLTLLGLLLLMKGLFSFLRQSLLNRQACQFNIRLTGSFYRSVLYLNKAFFDNRKTGDLIARLNDTLRIQQATSYILGDIAIQLLVLLLALSFLFVYSWPIGIFCLAMIPVIWGIVKYFEKDIFVGQRSVMIAHALNESNYVDSIRGIHTVKVMNRENLFAGLARDIFTGFQHSVFRLGGTKIRFNTVLEITTSLYGLAVIGWGALNVWNGTLHTGQMIAILQLAGLLMQTVVMVALTNLQVQEAVVALDRMYEFTILEPEYDPRELRLVGEGAPLSFQKLLLQKVSFRFPGRKLLLKDISMELKKGEIIALAGESGQGKSTLLQVLQKFYPAEGGPVWVNDRELHTIDTVAWRRLIGVVPQDIAIFSGSLLSNICLDFAPENIEKVTQFCARYGFDRYFGDLAQGYSTMLGEGGVALSGGQKQLLALARCLYANPQLLLLDEPTSAMDAATERFAIGILKRYSEQAGLLIISHKDALTDIADRVYLLEKGSCRELPRGTLKAVH